MGLLIDEAKLKACKTDLDRLILGLEVLELEISKKADERRNEDIAETKRMVDEAMAGVAKRLGERYPQFSLPGVNVGDDTKKDQFSMARAAVAIGRNDWSIAPYEHSVFTSKEHQSFMAKAASFGVDATGGFMAPVEVSTRFIEKLLPQSIAAQLGVNIEQVGNAGMLVINRETGTASAQWVGEMLTATKQDVKLGQMNLTPKAVSAKGDISNLLQLLGGGAAESRFVRSASRQMALAWDRAVLIGANSTLGPVGIANTPGIQTSSGASLTYDKLLDFDDKLMQANAFFGRLGWAMTVSKYTEVRKLKDTSNQPLVWRSVTEAGRKELLGHPIETTTQMGTTGAGTIIRGAFDTAGLYQWFGGIMIKRSDVSDTAMDNDLTRVSLRAYCDVGVDQPSAFVVSND